MSKVEVISRSINIAGGQRVLCLIMTRMNLALTTWHDSNLLLNDDSSKARTIVSTEHTLGA
jgi:hypothetical protein